MEKNTFAKRIKVLRGTIGVTQKQFSEIVEWSEDRIKSIEVGRKKYYSDLCDEMAVKLYENKNLILNKRWLKSGSGECFLDKYDEHYPEEMEIPVRICPTCSKKTKTPKADYCLYCGSELIAKCPKCGEKVIDLEQNFCGKGHQLRSDYAVSTGSK